LGFNITGRLGYLWEVIKKNKARPVYLGAQF
jgi:hypothetical protein